MKTSSFILAATILAPLGVRLSAQTAPSLIITSPALGTTIQPGQTLIVNVSGANPPASAMEGILVTGEIGTPEAQTSAATNAFQLTVPADIDPGSYGITAVESSPGGLVVSNTVTVTVQPNYTFDSLAADLSTIIFTRIGEDCPLVVQGSTNGVSHLVSNQFLTFTSGNPIVATVDASGLVTPHSPGSTQITMKYGNVTGSVSVTVGGAIVAQSPAATPTFSPTSGTYPMPPTVTLSDSTTGATVYFTTDGTMPTTASTPYTVPITVKNTETIEAIAVANGYIPSSVASAVYIIPQDFTMSLSGPGLTVIRGQTGLITATLSPVNGFNQPVNFTCSGLPTGAACSFSPSLLILNGTASATTSVTVTTTAHANLPPTRRPFEFAGLLASLSLGLASLRFRKRARLFALILLPLYLSIFATGCGSHNASTTPAPSPTTSTVTINATSGTLSHTATFTLTIN